MVLTREYITAFGGVVLTIGFRTRLSQAGDEFADWAGVGEAVFGSIFFGGISRRPELT